MMNTRRFGRTGIEISELTLGAGFVGGLLIHAPDDEKRACIAACLAAGINWIDTAPAYGDGASEKALNWLLAELPAEERPYLSTKFRLDTARRGSFGDQVRASLEASLAAWGRTGSTSSPFTIRSRPNRVRGRSRSTRRSPSRTTSSTFAGRASSTTSASPPSATAPPSALRSNRTVSTWRRSTTTC